MGTDHHQIRVPAEAMLPALWRAVGAMSEPMIGHDAVGFHLLSEEVARSIGGAVRPGRRRGLRRPPLVPADGAAGRGPGGLRRRHLRPRHAEMAQVVAPEHRVDADVSRAFAQASFAAPGADTAADRALRLDTTVMLVDDPVKRSAWTT